MDITACTVKNKNSTLRAAMLLLAVLLLNRQDRIAIGLEAEIAYKVQSCIKSERACPKFSQKFDAQIKIVHVFESTKILMFSGCCAV